MDVEILNGVSRITQQESSLSRVHAKVPNPTYTLDGYSLNNYSLNGYTLNGDEIDDLEEYCLECKKMQIVPSLNGYLNGRAERRARRAKRKARRKGKVAKRGKKRATREGRRFSRREARLDKKMFRKGGKRRREAKREERRAKRAARKEARQLAREERRARRQQMTADVFQSAADIGAGLLSRGEGQPDQYFSNDDLADYKGTTLTPEIGDLLPQQVQDILAEEGGTDGNGLPNTKGLFSPPKLLEDPGKWFKSKRVPTWKKVGVVAGTAFAADQLLNKGNVTKKIMGKKTT